MSPALEEATRLLRLAHRDADTFALLHPLPKASMSALGFHVQQAIEKALKRHRDQVDGSSALIAPGAALGRFQAPLPLTA